MDTPKTSARYKYFPQSPPVSARPGTSQSIFPTGVRSFPTPGFTRTLRGHLQPSTSEPVLKFESPVSKMSLSETRNLICDTLEKSNRKRRQQVENLLKQRLPAVQKRVETEPTERVSLTKSPVVERLPAALYLRKVARELWKRREEMSDLRERFDPHTPVCLETARDVRRKLLSTKALAAIRHFASMKIPAYLIPKLCTLVPKHPFSSKYSLRFLMACRSGDTQEVLRYLQLDRWLVLEIDNVGQTGLHWAARRNCSDLVEVLVQAGSYIDARDSLGRTPLFLASKSSNLAAVRFLLSHRANPFLRTIQNQSPMSVSSNLVIEKLLMRSMQLVLLMKFAPASKRQCVWEKEGLSYFHADADLIKKS